MQFGGRKRFGVLRILHHKSLKLFGGRREDHSFIRAFEQQFVRDVDLLLGHHLLKPIRIQYGDVEKISVHTNFHENVRRNVEAVVRSGVLAIQIQEKEFPKPYEMSLTFARFFFEGQLIVQRC